MDDRPPLHERLDRLEHMASHLAEQNDKTVREVHAVAARIEHVLVSLITMGHSNAEEAVDALADRVARLESVLAPGLATPPAVDPVQSAVSAFAAAALSSLEPKSRVFVAGSLFEPVAHGLVSLGYDVTIGPPGSERADTTPLLRPVVSVEIAATCDDAYAAAIVGVDADGTGATVRRRRSLLATIAPAIAAEGLLVVAVPSGAEPFDGEGPDDLPAGWAVRQRTEIAAADGTEITLVCAARTP
ncbi:MAG TPA: hypothetical protein VM030_05870 [Acidimicrobiales bacterium]|nr:hypothetical protein [Acidimicrobiales bacterium]